MCLILVSLIQALFGKESGQFFSGFKNTKIQEESQGGNRNQWPQARPQPLTAYFAADLIKPAASF
jgi:hypothetical protein